LHKQQYLVQVHLSSVPSHCLQVNRVFVLAMSKIYRLPHRIANLQGAASRIFRNAGKEARFSSALR